MKQNIRITIVGAGKYGKDLIAPKYVQNSNCKLGAVITPTQKTNDLVGSSLEKLPIFTNAKEWEKAFGKPSERDVFDLCVHPDYLPELISDLGRIGAKKIILPKPVATTLGGLKKIESRIKKYRMSTVVASQWNYSVLTQELAKSVNRLPLGDIQRVKMEFSQTFAPKQLQQYSTLTALLPHMIQILESIGLNHVPYHVEIKKSTPTRLVVELSDSSRKNPPIELITDLLAPHQVRRVSVWTKKDDPVIVADYLAKYENGKIIREPSLEISGKKRAFVEDTLALMTQHHLAYFNGSPLQLPILTLPKYQPIERRILEIAHQMG